MEIFELPLFYIGKVENDKVTKVTLGPFGDPKEAEMAAMNKYGWGCSDYRVLKTEQSFSIFSKVDC